MIHHLASFGWRYLLAVGVLALFTIDAFAPLLIRWVRFERRLYRSGRARGGYIADTPRRHW